MRDVFYISDLNDIRSNGVVTKREALHHIAKIFDLLGHLFQLYFIERCLYKNCGFLSNHGINHYHLALWKVGIM